MVNKNLWLHTEERPRISTIKIIVNKFAADRKLKVDFSGEERILPIMKNGLFTFLYKIEGIRCECVADIFVTIISGSASFTDYIVYMLFLQFLFQDIRLLSVYIPYVDLH